MTMGFSYYLHYYKNWIISVVIFSVSFWLCIFLSYEWSVRLLDVDASLGQFVVDSLGHTLFIYATVLLFGMALLALSKLLGFYRKKDLEILLKQKTNELTVALGEKKQQLGCFEKVCSCVKTGMVLTKERKILFKNQAMSDFLLNPQQADKITGYFDTEYRFKNFYNRFKSAKGKGYAEEMFLKTRKGPCIWGKISVTPVSMGKAQLLLWEFENRQDAYDKVQLGKDYTTVFQILSFLHKFDQRGDENELIRQLVSSIVRIYNLKTAFFAKYEHQKLRAVFAVGLKNYVVGFLKKWPEEKEALKDSALLKSIEMRRPVGYADLKQIPYYQRYLNTPEQKNLQATYAFPVIINNKVEGAISFSSTSADVFTKDLVVHLKSLINEICENISVRRNRQMAQAALRRYEEQLCAQIQELEDNKKVMEKQATDVNMMIGDLILARDAAEAANRSKTDFLANVSHELRTPLNAILGFSETIDSETFGPIGNKQYKEYIKYILDSGRHLLSLINDILDLSRVEVGHQRLTDSNIRVRSLIDEVEGLIQKYPGVETKKIQFSFSKDVYELRADERSLKQILLNVLSNAIKFTPTKGVIDIRVSVLKNKSMQIEVSDNGIGIPKNKISSLFKPFSQVENIMTRKHEGTGLGLALVKKLIELHQGTVKIKSVVGKGTSIYLIFPASRVIFKKAGDK